jgi:hypothetical protein
MHSELPAYYTTQKHVKHQQMNTDKERAHFPKSKPYSFRLNADEVKTLQRLVKRLRVSQSRVFSLALAFLNDKITK